MKLGGKYILDAPNKNGHIYTKYCFKKAVEDRFGSNPIPTYLMSSDGAFHKDIVGYTQLHFEENKSVVQYETELLDTINGDIVRTLVHDGTKLFIVPYGMGIINDRNEIEEYKLLSMNISTSSAFET